jgi:F0F1-type ATP synthase assembly protein I
MSQPEELKDIAGSPILRLGIGLASQIGILVVGIVIVAVVIGVWLDKTLNTKPLFTIFLLLGSGPVSLYLVYRVATNTIARIQSSSSQPISNSSDEGGNEE